MAVRFGSGGLQSVAPQTSKQVFKSAVAKAKRTGYSSGRSSGGGGGGSSAPTVNVAAQLAAKAEAEKQLAIETVNIAAQLKATEAAKAQTFSKTIAGQLSTKKEDIIPTLSGTSTGAAIFKPSETGADRLPGSMISAAGIGGGAIIPVKEGFIPRIKDAFIEDGRLILKADKIIDLFKVRRDPEIVAVSGFSQQRGTIVSDGQDFKKDIRGDITLGDQFFTGAIISPTSVFSPAEERKIIAGKVSSGLQEEFQEQILGEAKSAIESGGITTQQELDIFLKERPEMLQGKFEQSFETAFGEELASTSAGRSLVRGADLGTEKIGLLGKGLEIAAFTAAPELVAAVQTARGIQSERTIVDVEAIKAGEVSIAGGTSIETTAKTVIPSLVLVGSAAFRTLGFERAARKESLRDIEKAFAEQRFDLDVTPGSVLTEGGERIGQEINIIGRKSIPVSQATQRLEGTLPTFKIQGDAGAFAIGGGKGRLTTQFRDLFDLSLQQVSKDVGLQTIRPGQIIGLADDFALGAGRVVVTEPGVQGFKEIPFLTLKKGDEIFTGSPSKIFSRLEASVRLKGKSPSGKSFDVLVGKTTGQVGIEGEVTGAGFVQKQLISSSREFAPLGVPTFDISSASTKAFGLSDDLIGAAGKKISQDLSGATRLTLVAPQVSQAASSEFAVGALTSSFGKQIFAPSATAAEAGLIGIPRAVGGLGLTGSQISAGQGTDIPAVQLPGILDQSLVLGDFQTGRGGVSTGVSSSFDIKTDTSVKTRLTSKLDTPQAEIIRQRGSQFQPTDIIQKQAQGQGQVPRQLQKQLQVLDTPLMAAPALGFGLGLGGLGFGGFAPIGFPKLLSGTGTRAKGIRKKRARIPIRPSFTGIVLGIEAPAFESPTLGILPGQIRGTRTGLAPPRKKSTKKTKKKTTKKKTSKRKTKAPFDLGLTSI